MELRDLLEASQILEHPLRSALGCTLVIYSLRLPRPPQRVESEEAVQNPDDDCNTL